MPDEATTPQMRQIPQPPQMPAHERLYTLGFPRLSRAARSFVDGFRRAHDPLASAVEAHFTLVFGCDQLTPSRYGSHVAEVAARSPAIGFSCRHAALGADDADDMAYVFLVPDRGHAALSLLHDRLYSGALAPHLRLDLLYTPHITIARTRDRRAAKRLCDALNADGVRLDGRLDQLAVGCMQGGMFRSLTSYQLMGGVR